MNPLYYIALFIILVVLIMLKNRYEDKRLREEDTDNYETIQKYLLDDESLAKSKKPILWIHVPREYNTRNWLSFGSRSSYELNIPYLHLTVETIIKRCEESFTICIIDDFTFKKLIPNWSIDLSAISAPLLSNIRILGQLRLLELYGGVICPVSFLCFKDLIDFYDKQDMFVCETHGSHFQFAGAKKDCHILKQVIELAQRSVSLSAHEFNKILNQFVYTSKKIRLVEGVRIGTKSIDDTDILVDDLMSNDYLKLYEGCSGILIPMDELLNRRKYEWFNRLSKRQVLESNTILGNYFLINRENQKSVKWVSIR
jgi:hypothetical protein